MTTHDPLLDARESIEIDEFLIEKEWQKIDIDANWLDPNEEYHRPEYTLSYLGVPFAPLGGIHGLTGQPGHGKTFTFTQLILAILMKNYNGLKYELESKIPNPKVLYIDTEMEKGNTQLVMLRVYDQMGWTVGSKHDEFRILWLREVLTSEDRWRMVLKAIWTMRPTVVFLDGLIDIIGDFNDNKECQSIIYQCMATASHYNVSLWCLLHENPGSEKMVGHAGSFLERKATDILKTKKDKSSGTPFFTVSQNKARSRDLPDWHFRIEDDEHHYGHPVITDHNTAIEDKKIKLKTYPTDPIQFFKDNLPEEGLGKRDMRELLNDKIGIGHTQSDKYLIECVSKGYLTLSEDKKYIVSSQKLIDYSPDNVDPLMG